MKYQNETVFEFDKKDFVSVLKRINDLYESLTAFAKFSNVDRGYLSRHMNLKLINPPSPKILYRIADASKGITTYEELMRICGYLRRD